MIFATRRLREDLADERYRSDLLRQQLASKASECESWRWAAKQAMGSHEDTLIRRTRERDAARRELRTTEDQLGAARRENATRVGTTVAYSNQAVSNMRRLVRALRACARYRADASAQAAVIQQLTGQLFDAIGYQPAERALLDPPIAGQVTAL